MRAAVRRFHSPDIQDLQTYEPEDPEVFGFLLQVLAGPEDEPGEESFDILVCSPRWLANSLTDGELRWGRNILIAEAYDWPGLEAFVRQHFASVVGGSWGEVARQLGRLSRWEFDDYTL